MKKCQPVGFFVTPFNFSARYPANQIGRIFSIRCNPTIYCRIHLRESPWIRHRVAELKISCREESRIWLVYFFIHLWYWCLKYLLYYHQINQSCYLSDHLSPLLDSHPRPNISKLNYLFSNLLTIDYTKRYWSQEMEIFNMVFVYFERSEKKSRNSSVFRSSMYQCNGKWHIIQQESEC